MKGRVHSIDWRSHFFTLICAYSQQLVLTKPWLVKHLFGGVANCWSPLHSEGLKFCFSSWVGIWRSGHFLSKTRSISVTCNFYNIVKEQ